MRQYIGARYVPIFTGDYDATRAYEPLSIVFYGLNSYTSKKAVPVGVLPTDTEYWALTGNYDGRWEEIGRRLDGIEDSIDDVSERYPRRPFYMPEEYGAKVNDPSVDCATAIRTAIINADTDGGVVLLSAGVYYCHTSINIPNHLHCVDIIGAGSTLNGDTTTPYGTCLYYDGDGVFLHFSAGVWRCRFEDFDIKCTEAGTTCARFSDASTEAGDRSFFSCCRNVGFHFRACGVLMENAAYFDFDRCLFRAIPNTLDMNRCGLRMDGNNEYLSMRNSTFACSEISDLDGTIYDSCGVKLQNGRHNYFYNVDVTDCDHGFYILPTGDCYFTDLDDCDVARVHNGVYCEFDTRSIHGLSIRNIVYTAETTLDHRNRILKFNKTGGGGAYAARVVAENISIRTGSNEMDYHIEALGTAPIYPGVCKFTFAANEVPKVNYSNIRQIGSDFSTTGYIGNQTIDFNTYNHSGFAPVRFAADSPNGPGFECMLLVYADSGCTVQIAIPRYNTYNFAYRHYYLSSDTWSTWKTIGS